MNKLYLEGLRVLGLAVVLFFAGFGEIELLRPLGCASEKSLAISSIVPSTLTKGITFSYPLRLIVSR